MEEWKDNRGNIIEAGDRILNNCNEPPVLDVLTDTSGKLFLGDMETPFDGRYGFSEFWEVINKID